MKRTYIDVHIVHTVPPANLNRDDLGSPKEARFGGVRRSRVSSQAWKRATRKAFAEDLPEEQLGTRTKRIAAELTGRLKIRTGLDDEAAARLANALLAELKISPGKKPEQTAYLLFYGHSQLEKIVDLIADRAAELAVLDDTKLSEETKALPITNQLKTGHPIDVALFGRMVADIPSLNVDAATQVAHALSTHATELEFDYYTAVDDQNTDDSGAGMIGTVGFNSATLYRFATVGVHQLLANLASVEHTIDAATRFISAFARSMPTGYGNAFAHRTRPSVVAVVVRHDQPVNLVTAFEKPVAVDGGITEASAICLAELFHNEHQQWGDDPTHTAVFHTLPADSAADQALQTAFGPTRTFDELITGLRQALTSAVETSR